MQTSILNKTVTAYKNVYTKEGKPVNLLTWLTSKKYAQQVDEVRACADKAQRTKLKRELPAVITSGTIAAGGRVDNYTGLVCIDIDNMDPEKAKAVLSNFPCVAYAGVSVSGRGAFALVRVTDVQDNHGLHFKALRKDFESICIVIDNLPDIARLRYFSYDDNAYFNHRAEMYTTLARVDLRAETLIYSKGGIGTEAAINTQISIIERNGIDLTENESQWFIIGCALAHELGENGRGYFHRLSRLYPKYNYEEVQKKYNHILKNGGYKYSISSLFHILKPYI